MRADGTLLRGFGLLEAIVALAILAGTGMALFAWIGQNLRDVTRIEEAQARAALQLSAHGMVSSINPFVEPEGERRIGDLRIRWRSKLIEPMRPSVPFSATSVRWLAGLYELEVQALNTVSGLSADFRVEQAGLERVGTIKPRTPVESP